MPVTKQTYTAAATWTPSQLASIFRSAFIDAGYMTEWYASFTSGSVENCVLEIVYGANKTYGKCYYWFQFTTSGVWFHAVTGWNTSSNIPTGTQYLDYWSNVTSSTYSARQITGLSSTVNVDIIRYTSQINNTHDFFLIRQGTSTAPFTIAHPSHQVAGWIDLDKTFFSHFIVPAPGLFNNSAVLCFVSLYYIRRSYGIGTALIGDTSYGASVTLNTASFCAPGRASASFPNNRTSGSDYNGNVAYYNVVFLPNGSSSNNPAYTSNYNPVITGIPYSFYMTNSQLPSDFGIIVTYANNAMNVGDTFVVTAGVEEWEIIARANNATANTGASIAFAARSV